MRLRPMSALVWTFLSRSPNRELAVSGPRPGLTITLLHIPPSQPISANVRRARRGLTGAGAHQTAEGGLPQLLDTHRLRNESPLK